MWAHVIVGWTFSTTSNLLHVTIRIVIFSLFNSHYVLFCWRELHVFSVAWCRMFLPKLLVDSKRHKFISIRFKTHKGVKYTYWLMRASLERSAMSQFIMICVCQLMFQHKLCLSKFLIFKIWILFSNCM